MEGTDKVKTVIGEDVEIVGSVKCSSNVQIDGRLNGDLNCEGNAVIGSSAIIKGNIAANATTIHGQVNGNISSKDRIELKASARLTGDIRAKRLTVEDGVTFVGKSEVNPSGTATSRPAPDAGDTGGDAAKTAGGEDKGQKPGLFNKQK